ncbi:MAG: hypothetical protein L0Z55_09920 [Planctomycetes bacterium]|nr:hypothetical protein [Planctomycetota bacterium]
MPRARAEEKQEFALGRLPAEVAKHIDALGDEDWKTREEATRWLVRERASWMGSVPVDWRPAEPEAEWRWQSVLARARSLSGFGARLADVGLDAFRWELRGLIAELGEVTIFAALEPLLESGDERERQWAVELLAEFRGSDVELEPHWRRLGADPSPWVRRSAYAFVIARDRIEAERLLLLALCRNENDALLAETVQAASVVATPRIIARLREIWREASGEIREEIAAVLAARSGLRDEELVRWMLGSGSYRLAHCALRDMEEPCVRANLDLLVNLLSSPRAELRARAAHAIRSIAHAAPDDALQLLPLLESEDAELVELAASSIVRWQAIDYHGDLAASIGVRGVTERIGRAAAKPEDATPVSAGAAASKAGILPAPAKAPRARP